MLLQLTEHFKIMIFKYGFGQLLSSNEELKDRGGNSGGSWDPSSQKIFELAENI